MMSSYVDLLSNASTNYYSNNLLSHFSNFPPAQVNLNGEWEVPLTEIYHPNYFENVIDGVFYFGAYDEKNIDAALKNPATKARIVYKYSGICKNVEQVATAINNIIKTIKTLSSCTKQKSSKFCNKKISQKGTHEFTQLKIISYQWNCRIIKSLPCKIYTVEPTQRSFLHNKVIVRHEGGLRRKSTTYVPIGT